MQLSDSTLPLKDLVLVGGGHSHVHVIKMFGMNPLAGVRITVITKDIESPYSGMVPGYVAGYYTREECHIDVGKLCAFAKVRLVHAEVKSIDSNRRLIHCSDGRPAISYDILSINIGIVPRPLSESVISVAGVDISDVITPVKPIDRFAGRWERILARLIKRKDNSNSINNSNSSSNFTVAVVGGGAGGVELAFAVSHRLKTELHRADSSNATSTTAAVDFKVVVLNKGSSIMPSHSRDARNIVLRLLREKGIEVHNNAEVVSVEKESAAAVAVESVATTNETSTAAAAAADEGGCFLVARDGRRFQFHEAFWCTQAVAQMWTTATGLDCDSDGCIKVTSTLQSTNNPNVFACGDVCHLVDSPRPKAGVFAVRAGPPLYRNLCLSLRGLPLEPWQPQETFLGVIGTGDSYAVATKGGMGLEGTFLWKLKDRIDRVWMAGYQQLPTMQEMAQLRAAKQKQQQQQQQNYTAVQERDDAAPTLQTVAESMGQDTIDLLSRAQMRCGGCGSKVGSQVLQRALSAVRQLLAHDRDEVITGIGGGTDPTAPAGDDAALIMPPPAPFYLVQTIDYFRSFISDLYIMGQIAANHALSDVYAMNGEPVTAMALIVLPYAQESKVEEMLTHILAGALLVLRAANCALVGGHTSEGAEAAVGFAVTGKVHPMSVLPKGPLVRIAATTAAASSSSGSSSTAHIVEDSSSSSGNSGPLERTLLVLTKALGTGVVLAADMRAQAKGGWVVAAIESMQQSNAAAARVLSQHACVACTDVTGFGLMGHLLEMMQYSGNDSSNSSKVMLRLGNIPLLPGASECVEKGIFSSLHPQNIRCARAVVNPEQGQGVSAYPLLFDPQTSGGLLAAVPESQIKSLMTELRTAGYSAAAVIGHVLVEDETPPLLGAPLYEENSLSQIFLA